MCHRPQEVAVTADEYRAFVNGKLIQYAMPETPKEQRELFLSGLCDECFHKVCGPEESDDD